MYSQCITHSSSRKVTHSHHSARGESLNSGFPLCHLDTSCEGSWSEHVRGAMKIPEKMAEQRNGVNLSPPVPHSRHFDVMAALCFVMWRSCQISGPVTALSACLVGLTEPVMELRLNKRVITFPALGRTALSYTRGREEKASILHAGKGGGGGEYVTLQPPSKKM
ncbi:hypothetical protein PBY51_022374 [Eleginops maclovinus]|uniref:Uncharacterized protein n=1 Tax=Eleginops maclovinus TaxID=56733 RepID=A0AAN7XJQ7_ELEMC|nr:hypothetical protein PBY51_022374 [Eleginops maclovinus]